MTLFAALRIQHARPIPLDDEAGEEGNRDKGRYQSELGPIGADQSTQSAVIGG